MLDLTYPNILALFGSHLIPGRTETRAFLGWFLENYYRLEETDAQDAICDGVDDKGIDAIYVDENWERVVVFQSKLRQNIDKTRGDTDLKEFAGSLDQLKSKAAIEELGNSTGNHELKQLLIESDVANRVEKGYEVRGVFITNGTANKDAQNYLNARPDIAVFDGSALNSLWVPPGDAAPVGTAVTFSLDEHTPITYKTAEATVYIAPFRATDLVKMTGLQSGELFAWNVRQTLGKTKVNKAIAESIREQQEHKNFVLFHNGLTVLAEHADLAGGKLTISGYTVVNGCQSLTTLFENKASVSDELRLLTRIIQLPPASALAAKITRHSNNQNSISARDLQSNSTIQRRLQQEFREKLDGEFGYEIKRGEAVNAKHVITNEEAAKILLAFDLQQPWSCHQSYKLFDDLHGDIFGRREVTALRVATLRVVFDAVLEASTKIDNKLFGSYTLTRYFLLYLLRQALEKDEQGKQFVREPEAISTKIGFDQTHAVIFRILGDLVVDLNAEIAERSEAGTPFDYKRELKSQSAVKALAKDIIPSYQKAISRNRATSFSDELGALGSAD